MIITLAFLVLFISPVFADVKSSPQIVMEGSFLIPEGQKGMIFKASDGSLVTVTFNGSLYSNLSLIVRQKYDDSTGWYLRGKFTTNAFNNPKHFSCGIYYNTTTTSDQIVCAWSDAESIIYAQKYDLASQTFTTRTTVASAGDWRNVGFAVNQTNAFFVAYLASSDTTVKIRQSTDGGATWSGASTYTKTSAQAISLSLFIDLWNNLHIVTADKLAGNLYNITYSNSTPSGTSWMTPVVVSQSPFANSGAVADVFVNYYGNKSIVWSGNPNWVSDPTTSTMIWIVNSAPNTNVWTTPINISTNITEGGDTPFMIADYYGNEYVFYTDAYTTYNNNKCRYIKKPYLSDTWTEYLLESTCRYPIPIGTTWGTTLNTWVNITQIDLIYGNTTSSTYYFMNENLTGLSSTSTLSISGLSVTTPIIIGASANISFYVNIVHDIQTFMRYEKPSGSNGVWSLLEDGSIGTKNFTLSSGIFSEAGTYNLTVVACQEMSWSTLNYTTSFNYTYFNGQNCDEKSINLVASYQPSSEGNTTTGNATGETYRIVILPIDVTGFWSLPAVCFLNGYFQKTSLANFSMTGSVTYFINGVVNPNWNPSLETTDSIFNRNLYACIYTFDSGLVPPENNFTLSIYPLQSESYNYVENYTFSTVPVNPYYFKFYITTKQGCHQLLEFSSSEECKAYMPYAIPTSFSFYCKYDATKCAEVYESESQLASICTRWGKWVGISCENYDDIPLAYRKYVNSSENIGEVPYNTNQSGQISSSIEDQTNAFFGLQKGNGQALAFWSLVFSISVVIIVAILMSQKTNMGASIGQISAILFMGFLVMFTMIGWFPWWILLIFGVITAMIISKWIVPHFSGGS